MITVRILAALGLMAYLPNCGGDETLTGYGAADVEWQLQEIAGERFAARATLSFPEEGKLSGDAPCNSYTGRQTAPYPWFQATDIAVTRRACPDLPAETRFLQELGAMTLAEVVGDTLILSDDDGREMVFHALR